jgi:DNA-binding LacI/PurR family transcriptional regulator
MTDKRQPDAAMDEGGPASTGCAVTMVDVAQRAGVSTATVSRVLSGNISVAPEMRAKVSAAVEELSYRPNRLARNLRRQNAEMVGVVISDIENPNVSEMVHVAEEEAYRRGYRVLLCNTDEKSEKQQEYLQMLADERPLGVIISPCDPAGPEISQLIDLGIAVVAFDRPVRDVRADAVLGDNFEAARIAVEHLARSGLTRIAYLGIPTQIETGARRLAGYRAAMVGLGLEPRSVDGGVRMVTGLHATEDLLRQWPDIEALVVGNNMLTLGALRTLKAENRRVPEDVAIVAFDEPIWADLVRPSLTTLGQPIRAMTSSAVRLLIDNIEGQRREPQRIVFRFNLTVRESSRRGGDVGLHAEAVEESR